MEPTKATVVIGHYAVVDKEDRTIKINLGNSIFLEAQLPSGIDVKHGDIVKLQLEV